MAEVSQPIVRVEYKFSEDRDWVFKWEGTDPHKARSIANSLFDNQRVKRVRLLETRTTVLREREKA